MGKWNVEGGGGAARDKHGTYGGGSARVPHVDVTDRVSLDDLTLGGGFYKPTVGRTMYGAALSGRLKGDIPVGRGATLTPYVDLEVAKESGRAPHTRAPEFGVVFEKKFAKGGAVRGCGCVQRGVKRCKIR